MAAPTDKPAEKPSLVVLSRIVFMRDAYAYGVNESGTTNNVQNITAGAKTEIVWDVGLGVVRVAQMDRADELYEFVVPITALCQMFPKKAEKKK